MKRLTLILISMLSLVMVSSLTGQEKDKLAQTGFQFLSVVSDARAASMGEAMTSLQVGSSALFFNPAGMAELQGTVDLTASLNSWIADINHNAFSLAFSPTNGNWGVFGFSAQSVDYGDFYGTKVVNNDKGFEDTGIFSLNALALGFGYARSLSEQFSVGGQVRWVRQDLGESASINYASVDDSIGTEVIYSNELTPLAYDFGTQYKTGFKSLVFGMSVRNFSREIKYVEEGFQLPLVFNLGVSMNAMDFFNFDQSTTNQSLYISIDASHFRSHPEQFRIGLDYRLMNTLSLRSGYVSSNEENAVSMGLGVDYMGLRFDYAYSPFGVFNEVQRMTVAAQF